MAALASVYGACVGCMASLLVVCLAPALGRPYRLSMARDRVPQGNQYPSNTHFLGIFCPSVGHATHNNDYVSQKITIICNCMVFTARWWLSCPRLSGYIRTGGRAAGIVRKNREGGGHARNGRAPSQIFISKQCPSKIYQKSI